MKHIVILGKLESKYLCPYFKDDCTIISMNNHYDSYLIPRVDLWFDIHNTPDNTEAQYTKENFPFEEYHKLVGRRFCSTMSYMIAWAVLQDAEKISIYGAKFTDDGNPRRQRELHNVRELLFYCLGRDIKLEICEDDLPYLFPEHIPDEGVDFDQ